MYLLMNKLAVLDFSVRVISIRHYKKSSWNALRPCREGPQLYRLAGATTGYLYESSEYPFITHDPIINYPTPITITRLSISLPQDTVRLYTP